MPLKNDESRRWVEMEFTLPGTPEQIWEAIATGPGMAAWFTPAKVEEHEGGTIAFDFGDGITSQGKVIEWQAPHRFTYEEYNWCDDAPPLATEITITSRSGGKCVVRMVHSLFTSEEKWDDQFDSFESGWPGFIEVLKVYLTRHAGEKAAVVKTSAVHRGDEAEAWEILKNALALTDADAGGRWISPEGAPAGSGTIERILQTPGSREIMVRLEEPGPARALFCTYHWAGQNRVMISIYCYGDDAEKRAATGTAEWDQWIREQFPAT